MKYGAAVAVAVALLRLRCQSMGSMAERGADFRGTLGLVVTQGFLGTLGSQVWSQSLRGLYLTPDKPDLRDQLLGDRPGQGLREHAFPIADRELHCVVLCTVRLLAIIPDGWNHNGYGYGHGYQGSYVYGYLGWPYRMGTRMPIIPIPS